MTVTLLALIAVVTGASRASAGPLTLTVQPSSVQHASGDPSPIPLQLMLTLNPSANGPVTICTFAEGSIRVVGFQGNGVRTRPGRTLTSYFAPPSILQEQNLVAIAPGGSASMPFTIAHVPDGVLLDDVRLSRAGLHPHKVLEYVMPFPGQYTFTLRYHYKGPDGGHTDVFRQSVDSGTVTMTLVQ